MDFQRQGGDVLVVKDVRRCIDQRGIGNHGKRCVDQVKNHAQIDGKGFLALTHEHAPGRVATGDIHVVDVLGSVGRIVGNSFGADVVHRFVEHGSTTTNAADRCGHTGTAVSPHKRQRELLIDIERRVIRCPDLAGLGQRYRHILAADRQRNTLENMLEAELERQVLAGVSVVVDMYLVQCIRVHLEIVGTTISVLQWLVIGNHGDKSAAPGLVTVEQVKVSAVYFGLGCDERCLAMAGSLCRKAREHRGGHHYGSTQVSQSRRGPG